MEAPAGALEGLIGGDVRVVRQPDVEQRRLGGAVAQVIPLGVAEARHRRELLDPFLGQEPEAAVPQGDELLAAAQRREELRQAHRLPLELGLAVELEPVDAGGDRHLEAAGGAVELPLRLDRPPFGEQVETVFGTRFAESWRVGGSAGESGSGGSRARAGARRSAARRRRRAAGSGGCRARRGRGARSRPSPRAPRRGRRARRWEAAHPARGEQAQTRARDGARLLDLHRGGSSSRGRSGAASRRSRSSSRSAAGTRNPFSAPSRVAQPAPPSASGERGRRRAGSRRRRGRSAPRRRPSARRRGAARR